MLEGVIILLFTCRSCVVRGLTRYDNNTCYDTTAGDYRCCSNYEEINGECIKCNLGFQSRKGVSCELCLFNFFGKACTFECMCDELQRCDNVKGCVEIEKETTSKLTTKSNIAEAISSEESVTKVHAVEQNDGLSKTEILILFCGALSGIIVLLGILGISNCVKKRMNISKSKREKTVEKEVDKAEEHATQDTFELHESLYESIDDSHLGSILLPQTFSFNLEKDYDSSSSGSLTICNDDQASYQHPVSSLDTKESSCHKDEQSQNEISKSNYIVDQSLCSPYPPIEVDASGYEISGDCTYDRASYLNRNNTLVDKTSYCHIYDIEKMTTKSNTSKAVSSEESVTKVHEEEQNDGLSKTELLMLYAGASSAIIVLLGIVGITKCLKKRMRMSKSKRDKTSEEEVHTAEEQEMPETFELHESHYETIDDSHLDSILFPQTCNPNLEKDDESQSFGSSANCDDDRSIYLEPISSPITMETSFEKNQESHKKLPSSRKSTCIENQTSCSPNLEINDKSSNSGSSTNCNDDRSIYLQTLNSLITKDSSCHTEEQSREVFPSANNSTCIADQTSCDPYLAIEEDDSDNSSSEFSEDATLDRSSYLHPYNTLFNETSSCHIYEICQNEPFSE